MGVAEEAAAVAHRLVDDHRALRQHRGDVGGEIFRRRLALARSTASAPLPGIAAGGAPSSSTSACSAASAFCSTRLSTCSSAPSLVMAARLARIGEEADRRHGVDQDQVIVRRQRLHARRRWDRARARAAAGPGRARCARWSPPSSAWRRSSRRCARRAAASAACTASPPSSSSTFFFSRSTRAALRTACGSAGGATATGSGVPTDAAVVPRRVARQDQRRDAARRRARRLHRRRGVVADAVRTTARCARRSRPAAPSLRRRR